ncbi:MAG: WbqC family protein [Prevotella sp.]|nr:WbqC family protein [Prevotella sp.]
MTTALLQTTYFGPVQWYQKLYRYDHCLIEQYDSYQKQTYRNRCVIATANGLQALTVPVEHHANSQMLIANSSQVKDLRISDHNQWRKVHWNALQSAYSESPFFEYYVDDIRPFFEHKYDFLIDFNEAIRQKICELIDIHPHVEYTTEYVKPTANSQQPIAFSDFREVIHVKHPQPDADFEPHPYWQVFQHRYGFQPNLSILDLLFCMGPESVFYL